MIGGASLDRLHFAGRSEASAGGAGLYTALAAARAGARVRMIAPRPDPMPGELAPALERIDWRGPRVRPEELPSFEIAHLGGGHTDMRAAQWRSESLLDPERLEPEDLDADLVYCIPLTDPARQVAFLERIRAHGRRAACGTFAQAVDEATPLVRRSLELADLFFCNEREARGLFGSLDDAATRPGAVLFATRGPRGVRVVQGRHATDVPPVPARELDPTGAGDTLCGTVLAHLATGAHPVEAARAGVAAAAEMVTAVGPAALLRSPPPPPPPEDPRARTDAERIERVAGLLADAGEATPFDFLSDVLPPAGDPGAVDYFFAATLQQFGFWTMADGRYAGPVVAPLGGRSLKGSDLLWECYRRWLHDRPRDLRPEAQAALGEDALRARLRDDRGEVAIPECGGRAALARSYGGDLLALGLDPTALVERANASPRPLDALLRQLDAVGGYKEDPLRKKSALLGLILRQRPEGFLRDAGPGDEAPPVVDYHVQRSCLRLGLVRIGDEALRRRVAGRERLEPADEDAVRRACFAATREVRRRSGRSMGAVDWFFFQNRRRCPEMEEPLCDACPADPVCAHATGLFQPVFRTTFY